MVMKLVMEVVKGALMKVVMEVVKGALMKVVMEVVSGVGKVQEDGLAYPHQVHEALHDDPVATGGLGKHA